MPSRREATELSITIDSRPDHLSRLRTVIGCLAAKLGMTSEEIQDTKLAVTEACANAIRHGSPDGEDSTVQIKLVANPSGILAEVTDQGTGFDVESLVIPTPGQRPGGLGIPLMRTLSDRVEFLHNTRGMTVRLFKRARRRRSPSF